MTSLIKYAEKLATDPPLDVYRRVMKLVSDEQLSGLGPEPEEHELGWEEYQKKKQECLQVAKKDEDVAKFSVTSICDFVAMCTMMIGAGSARIEALKQAIHGKQQAGSFETADKDVAHLLLHDGDSAKKLEDLLSTWGKLKGKGNGVVQLKFPAGGDFHTFAVERVSPDNAETRFVVYQAYQNTYSLAHFLGRSPSEDEALDKYHRQVYEAAQESQKGDIAIYKKYESYYNKEVKRQFENITTAAANIGKEQLLTAEELKVRVTAPLANMLRGEIRKKDYVDLTGSPTKTARLKADFMFVLMCNQVSPDKYDANCKALYRVPNDLTTYVA